MVFRNSLGVSAIRRPDGVVNMANGKDNAMKTNRKRKQERDDERKTAAWLNATMRNGRRRIEVIGWKRLAAIYNASKPGSAVRQAINAEARRCGYTPSTILALNAE